MLRKASLALASLLGLGLGASCVFELDKPGAGGGTATTSGTAGTGGSTGTGGSAGTGGGAPKPGDVLWTQHFGSLGHAVAKSVAIDGEDNVLVAGTFSGKLKFDQQKPLEAMSPTDIFLIKLAKADGTFIWGKRYSGAGGQAEVNGSGPSVAVDGAQNVYLAGTVSGDVDFGNGPTSGTEHTDAFVLKLGMDGKFEWVNRYGSDDGDKKASAVAIDPENNVLVTGSMETGISFGKDCTQQSRGRFDLFVLKLDRVAGDCAWSKRLGDPADDAGHVVDAQNQQGVTIVVDSNGDVAVAGYVEGSLETLGMIPRLDAGTDKTDIVLLKFAPDGGPAWGRLLESSASLPDPQPSLGSLTVPPGNDILLVGSFEGGLDVGAKRKLDASAQELFLVRSASDGGINLVRSYGNGSSPQQAWAIASDTYGRIALTGRLTGNVQFDKLTHEGGQEKGEGDAFVLMLDADNVPLWETPFVGRGEKAGYAIAANQRSAVMAGVLRGGGTISGTISNDTNYDQALVVKLANPPPPTP